MIEIQNNSHLYDITNENPYYKKWYISKTLKLETYYLHSDGIWRDSTEHNKVYSGYYPTKEIAELILKEFEGDDVEYIVSN